MKTTLMFLMIALLALAACAPTAQETPAPTPAPVESTPEPVAVAESEPEPAPSTDYSLADTTRAKVTSNLKSTTKYYLSESFVKLAPGQHHTFGIGFTNRIEKRDNFLVSVTFNKAYDKNSNSIDVTDEQIATWLAQNDFAITPLDINQQSIQPVVIEVTDFADGTAPAKGSYQFDVEVLYQNGLFSPTSEYSGRLPVVIQVI